MAGMVGGASALKEADVEVQNVCDQIRGVLEKRAGRTFLEYKAVEYKTQVVAGINYFVKINIGDNKYVHVRIHKPLPHTAKDPELNNFKLDLSAEEELSYF